MERVGPLKVGIGRAPSRRRRRVHLLGHNTKRARLARRRVVQAIV